MKKVLIVAYYFPPAGGAGVQRILKYAKYLPQYGWQPHILTVPPESHEVKDETFLDELPECAVIRHAKIFEPYDLYRKLTGNKNKYIDVNSIKKEGRKKSFTEKFAEFVRSAFFIPDARMFWRINAVREGVRFIRECGIDAIYSSGPPYTCELIGRDIKRKTGLPWITGPRDPWTGYISAPERPFPARNIDRAFERSVWREADAADAAWPGIIEDAISKYPELEARRDHFFHNPNGFDPDDYPPSTSTETGRFVLTYTGSLFGKASPEFILKALEKLVSAGKIKLEDFLFRVIGRYGDIERSMLEKTSVRDSVEMLPYLPHKKSVEYLMKSDALLMLCSGTDYTEYIVPGKLYEYMGAGKPIISISPETGKVAEIIRRTGTGKNADETDIDKIAEIFLDFFRAKQAGRSPINPVEEEIKKYRRDELAKNLAEILSKITEK